MHSTSLHQAALTAHQSQAVQTVDRYWHQLAGLGAVPKRSEIDPAVIQDALEYAFIAEHLSQGHAKLRVAGGSISSVLGMEVAGMPMAVLVSPENRSDFTQHVARVFAEPVKMTLSLTAPPGFGQPALTAHLRLYPLTDAAGRVKQLIGSFVTSGVIGRTPRRFTVTSVDATPVSSPTALHPTPLVTRGHLSLVVSNT